MGPAGAWPEAVIAERQARESVLIPPPGQATRNSSVASAQDPELEASQLVPIGRKPISVSKNIGLLICGTWRRSGG
jgi:hypothetical protein